MARFTVEIAFRASIEIDAKDEDEAMAQADAIASARSVYVDDWVDEITNQCYLDGAEGKDFELRRTRGYEFRDKQFEPEVEIRRYGDEMEEV